VLTGDYGCNATYQDPKARSQPFAGQARIFKNHNDRSRVTCNSMNRGGDRQFPFGRGGDAGDGVHSWYVLHREFSLEDAVNGGQI
jgi:hypothetical protein